MGSVVIGVRSDLIKGNGTGVSLGVRGVACLYGSGGTALKSIGHGKPPYPNEK